MKPAVLILLHVAAAVVVGDHPAAKVIKLLEDLKTSAGTELQGEELVYQKYERFCAREQERLNTEIAEHKSNLEALTATSNGAEATMESASKKITMLDTTIGDREADKTKTDGARTKELGENALTKTDLEGTIQAIDDAMGELETSKSETSLLQAEPVTPSAEGSVTEHVKDYSFKSGSVMELLKSLRLEFEDKLNTLNTGEQNAVNAHEVFGANHDDMMAALNKQKGIQTGVHGTADGDKIKADADIDEQNGLLSAAETDLKDSVSECSSRSDEWTARQKARKEEIVAVDQAITILGEVTGLTTRLSDKEHLFTSNFFQITHGEVDPKARAINLIKEAARQTKSQSLRQFAQQLSHMTGPFDQINNMIEKMIWRLNQEQKDEDTHKNWCDKELAQNNLRKQDKKAALLDLNADIQQFTAQIDKLGGEIGELESDVAELDSEVADESELRAADKKTNAKAVKEAQETQTAIGKATAILQEYYSKSSLLQKTEPTLPWAAGETYTGNSGKAGVLAALETVGTNYAKFEAEVSSDEATAENEHRTFLADSKKTKALKTKTIELKTEEKSRTSNKLEERSKVHKRVTSEQEMVTLYLKDLEPACINGDDSYDSRKGARAQEKEALQEAHEILKNAFSAEGSKKNMFLAIHK